MTAKIHLTFICGQVKEYEGGVKNYIRHQIWKLDGWTACVLKGHFSDNHRNNVDEQSQSFISGINRRALFPGSIPEEWHTYTI